MKFAVPIAVVLLPFEPLLVEFVVIVTAWVVIAPVLPRKAGGGATV